MATPCARSSASRRARGSGVRLEAFSAELMWGPTTQTFEGQVNFGHLAGVEAEGPHRRVVFRTKHPDPAMPQRLAAYGGWIHSNSATR